MHKTIAYFDIETNGITDWSTLSDLETLHCLVIIDQHGTHRYREPSIKEGLDRLSMASTIIGHNAVGFDVPALWRLYGFRHPSVQDTAIMARLLFPDVLNDDFKR